MVSHPLQRKREARSEGASQSRDASVATPLADTASVIPVTRSALVVRWGLLVSMSARLADDRCAAVRQAPEIFSV